MTSPEAAAHHMARALQLARRGLNTSHPNPSVGCVIVRDGEIVGEGFHAWAGSAHGEPIALAQAGDKARGAEMFVTLEPCSHHGRTPPCADAVVAAGIRKVWAALEDPNPKVSGGGLAKLREAGIEVELGLMQREAALVHRGFISRMTRGRPLVTLKLAASVDGRTAMASGESKWITSEAARADVQRLRAEAGAVLSSSETVLADDPQLNLRLPGEWRQPDRIVLDTHARVPAGAKVWNEGARRLWLTARPAAAPAGVEQVVVKSAADGKLDLNEALKALGAQAVNHVLVECGPRLAGALVMQGLADEILLYIAPSLLGHDARALVQLPGLERLEQRIPLKFSDVRSVGPDLRVTMVRA